MVLADALRERNGGKANLKFERSLMREVNRGKQRARGRSALRLRKEGVREANDASKRKRGAGYKCTVMGVRS